MLIYNALWPKFIEIPSEKCLTNGGHLFNPRYAHVRISLQSTLLQVYSMDCYFRQSWVDRRLAFTGSMQTLGVSVNILERLWKPDTHFFNGKRSYLHTVTTPNKLLRINQDGRILYSMRHVIILFSSSSMEVITNIIMCGMKLLMYSQTSTVAPLKFGSGLG